MKAKLLLSAALLPLLAAGLASAGAGASLTFDEFGHGAFGPGFIGNDPGPGGLNGVLTYRLLYAGVQGDVFLHDADVSGSPFLDVLRFNGDGTLIFYSDNIDGADAPADTPAPPSAFYANRVDLQEIGPEGNNGAFYTPTPNQPGYDPGFAPITYHFVSDGVAPEPASALLVAFGAMLLGIGRGRRAR